MTCTCIQDDAACTFSPRMLSAYGLCLVPMHEITRLTDDVVFLKYDTKEKVLWVTKTKNLIVAAFELTPQK